MKDQGSDQLGLLLNETARAWRTRLDQRLKPLGLSQAKWRTLLHLASSDQPLTQAQVAARLGIEGASMKSLLDRLESDGWIKRQHASHDRRCKTVHLRSRANGILDRIFETTREVRAELLDDIPSRDLQTCAKTLASIRDKAVRVATSGGSSSDLRHN